MDLKTITLSGLVGAILWELIRQFISVVIKRRQDAADGTRKLLREDLEQVVKLVCEVQELSISYFATDFDDDQAKEYSKQVRGKLKTGGMKITALNAHLQEKGKVIVDLSLWTRFKAATTKDLDVKRDGVWSDADPRLNDIYKAANNLHTALSRSRYSTV